MFLHLETVLQRVRDKSRDQLCGTVHVTERVVQQYELGKTLHEIWRFMNDEIASLGEELIEQLQILPWLLITHQSGSYLVAPKNIFSSVSVRFAPLWFPLPNLYTADVLAEHVTCGLQPSASDARAALRTLHQSRAHIVSQPVEGDSAHVTVDLVLELIRLAATTDELDLDLPVVSAA